MENLLHDCLQCGGDLQVDARTGVLTCIYCGRQYHDGVEGISHDIKEIVSRRQMREFIQAEELCRNLIQKQPLNAEVYWQKVLCELGVVYVHENGNAKPTFFSYSYDSRLKILDNPDYKKAVENAQNNQDKEYYKNQAVQLDVLLKEFFELVAKENSYDIFISFKKTTEAIVDGEKTTIDTDDYFKAREIYNALKDRYKVFFSPVSIGGDTGIYGEKYEPRILKALQTSQAMILVGSKRDYIQSNWVENEWRRYQYFIQKGLKQKNSLILGYVKNMPALPPALREIQLPSFDMFKVDYLTELSDKLSFIKSSKGLKSTLNSRKIRTDFLDNQTDTAFKGSAVQRISLQNRKNSAGIQIEASESREFSSAESMRTNGSFNDAIMMYSQVLRKNQNNAKAYFGRFLCKIKAKKQDEIAKKADNITNDALNDLQNAIEHAPNEIEAYGYLASLYPVFEAKERDPLEGIKNPDAYVASLKKKSIAPLDNAINKMLLNDIQKKYYIPVCSASMAKKELVFEFINKYITPNHAVQLIKNFEKLQQIAIKKGDLKTAERIYDWAQKIFFEEKHDFNLAYVYGWAKLLFEHKHYAVSLKYFEELASSPLFTSGECYYYILRCRLKDAHPYIKNWSFKADTSDDMTIKKPSELDIDEIIERIFVCDKGNKTSAVRSIIAIAKEQAARGYSKANRLIELIINCFRGLDKDDFANEFIKDIANTYIFAGKFNKARTFVNELLAQNEKDANAHWLLLKCKLKLSTDSQLSYKGKSLFKVQEFNNALNCADDKTYNYYMDVYNGKVKNRTYTEKQREKFNSNANYKKLEVKLKVFYLCLLAFSLCSLLFQSVFYTYIHFGWHIAIISCIAVLTFVLGIVLKDWRGYKSFSGFSFLITLLILASSITSMCVVPNKPIMLTNEKQFNILNNLPTAGDCDYVLTKDMDFKGSKCTWYGKVKEFNGTFDGGGYTLSNIVVKAKTQDCREGGNSYFGFVKENRGTIKNLNFTNCEIKLSVKVSSEKYISNSTAAVGTICGFNKGLVTDCNVTNTYVLLWHESTYYRYYCVSGIVGYNNKEVSNCKYICDNKNENYSYSLTFVNVKGLSYSSNSGKIYCRGICYNNSNAKETNCVSECTTGSVVVQR